MRQFLTDENKKDDLSIQKLESKEKVSLEVAGSDATANPLASFSNYEMDPDLIDQLYCLPMRRVPKGEGAYWDQDEIKT